jgi:hypothetical protein
MQGMQGSLRALRTRPWTWQSCAAVLPAACRLPVLVTASAVQLQHHRCPQVMAAAAVATGKQMAGSRRQHLPGSL